MNREMGEKSRAWKGMEAGYVAKHSWIVKHYGNAKCCINCNTKTAKRYEWANLSGKYLRTINDYIELCPSCHRKKDKGDFCKRGHKFTIKNTRITKEGWRTCRECHKNYQLKWFRKKHDK